MDAQVTGLVFVFLNPTAKLVIEITFAFF